MAHELGPFGITVNCIAPAFLSNPTTQAQWDSYARTDSGHWSRGSRRRRLGKPADIANACSSSPQRSRAG